VALHGFRLSFIVLTFAVVGACIVAALNQWKRREL